MAFVHSYMTTTFANARPNVPTPDRFGNSTGRRNLAPSIARDVQSTTSPTYDRPVGSSPLSAPEPREEGGCGTDADAVPTEVTVCWACQEEST